MQHDSDELLAARLATLAGEALVQLRSSAGIEGKPLGKLGDHVSQPAMERASSALVEKITLAARERLPVAIAEFDVGGLVRKKVSDYPVAKLEELVLSVAQQHLKTIELFGAIIGFFIGVAQAIYFWFTWEPGR